MLRRTPISTRTYTLVPYTTLFRSNGGDRAGTFAIAWSLPWLDEMTRAVVMRQSIIAMAAVAVFVAVSLMFVNLRLCKPLAEITATTKHKIGRAHVCTPITNAHLVCRLLLEKKKKH